MRQNAALQEGVELVTAELRQPGTRGLLGLRLAGVMSQFRPGGPQRGSHLVYSPWCVPGMREGVKSVVVHHDLRDSEMLAWDFCVNFARDNQLQVMPGRTGRRTPAPG